MITDKHATCLKELAHLQAGYFSRTRIRSSQTGTYLLLQAKDISSTGDIMLADAVRFTPKRTPELYQVSLGDILLVARGQAHTACLITTNLDNTLVSNVFYIIRTRQDIITPGYLTWWLNQADTQALISVGARGTGIEYVSRKIIENLRVPVPPIDQQRQIEKVNNLWRQQQALQKQLNEKQEQLMHAICRQAIQPS